MEIETKQQNQMTAHRLQKVFVILLFVLVAYLPILLKKAFGVNNLAPSFHFLINMAVLTGSIYGGYFVITKLWTKLGFPKPKLPQFWRIFILIIYTAAFEASYTTIGEELF